jgi:hypothetical protein
MQSFALLNRHIKETFSSKRISRRLGLRIVRAHLYVRQLLQLNNYTQIRCRGAPLCGPAMLTKFYCQYAG